MDKSVRAEALPRLLLPALSLQTKKKQPDLLSSCIIHFLRYHPDSDRGIKVLQTFALPLGYGTKKAVDETRTRDLHLGKVALYQLSYYRALAGYYSNTCMC